MGTVNLFLTFGAVPEREKHDVIAHGIDNLFVDVDAVVVIPFLTYPALHHGAVVEASATDAIRSIVVVVSLIADLVKRHFTFALRRHSDTTTIIRKLL
jgi:hypothetical protein